MARAHNEHILELVDGVMAAAGLAPGDLDGVAFGCGPGSFTGIRIAASVAQAIAFGADARVLPVSSTLALARAALEGGVPVGAGVIASIRSRRDAWYLAAFALTGGRLVRHRPDCLFTADPGWPEVGPGKGAQGKGVQGKGANGEEASGTEVQGEEAQREEAQGIEAQRKEAHAKKGQWKEAQANEAHSEEWQGDEGDGWVLVGDRPVWTPPHRACHSDIAVSASLIARIGAEALAAGKGVAPELGLPVYVSGDSLWKPGPAAPGTGTGIFPASSDSRS